MKIAGIRNTIAAAARSFVESVGNTVHRPFSGWTTFSQTHSDWHNSPERVTYQEHRNVRPVPVYPHNGITSMTVPNGGWVAFTRAVRELREFFAHRNHIIARQTA